MDIKNQLIRWVPYWCQDVVVSIYNTYLYWQRHTGMYREFGLYYAQMDLASPEEIQKEADRRLAEFLELARSRSNWYSRVESAVLSEFPVLNKSDIVENLESIATISSRRAIVGRTGGTTGASMKVLFTKRDMQERFAVLDHFRRNYGYTLGRRTAWFSGKSLATQEDVGKGRCYRDDFFNKIRFFSTFHINAANFESYWRALDDYSPEFIVGFPSSVYEICRIAKDKGFRIKKPVHAFFPTAETVLSMHREVIEATLGCKVVDQYASAEGAPFILECEEGRLHIHPLTGVFEVVDESMRPAAEGELLVTSFSTRGTPLIRYRIGDRVAKESLGYRCPCGSCFPVVKWIDGRTSDFLWSPEFGRVNLGNLSNSTKNVDGIVCFQAVQHHLDVVEIYVVGNDRFDKTQENLLLEALRLRLGQGVKINVNRVPEIPREKSGKFRIVKNNISNDLLNMSVGGMPPESAGSR